MESNFRVASQSSFSLNAKSEGKIGAKAVRLRASEEAILESRNRLSMLADGDIVIGNGNARLVLKKNGDIDMVSSGHIRLNGKRIDMN